MGESKQNVLLSFISQPLLSTFRNIGDVMQPKLPLVADVMYECANPQCFYVGSLFTFEDVEWKHVWDSNIEDLTLSPRCAACSQPMMYWEGE